jgi:uncharacterized protein
MDNGSPKGNPLPHPRHTEIAGKAASSEVRVALFAKWPEKGKVKTRLAAALGEDAALQAYLWLVERQVGQLVASALPWDLWIAPASAKDAASQWQPLAHRIYAQPEGDLGHRLQAATRLALSQNDAGLLLIGADCPYLTAEILKEMAVAVAQGRFALAPTEDGGYAAFGLPMAGCTMQSDGQWAPRVFQDMPWSTPALMTATLGALRQSGHEPQVWPSLLDCDEAGDWQRIRRDFA